MIATGFIPQNETTRISLVRHASVHNPSNIFYGRLPRFSLSRRGFLEACRTANAFKHVIIDEMITSPLLRCRQTAIRILKFHQHLKLRQSSLLTEVSTPFQGMAANVVDAKNGDVYTDIDPPYEQPEDVLFRTQRFLYQTRIKCFGKHVVAVTHGDLILFMLLWVSKTPATALNKTRFTTLNIINEYPAPSSVTTLCYATDEKDEQPSATYFNPNEMKMIAP